jgi:hypothetical protein
MTTDIDATKEDLVYLWTSANIRVRTDRDREKIMLTSALKIKDAGSPRTMKILHPALTGIWSGNV